MSLETRRKIAMLKWLGKICRMSDNRLVKYVFDNINFKWLGRGRARRHTWEKKDTVNYAGIWYIAYF